MKLSLAGDLGSGKGTVSAILAPRIGAEIYGTGTIMRKLAAERGMTLGDFGAYVEAHPEIDREVDNNLALLSDDPRTLILDSRMAWYFVRDTYRVYLTTDPIISALRIKNANRGSIESFETLEEAVAGIRARKESEKRRYLDLYGVNSKDLVHYDLVVDTSYISPDETSDIIEAHYHLYTEGKVETGCYICPKRFYYPDDAADMEEASRLSTLLDAGESLPEVTAVYRDENFYIVDGVTTALAYSLSERHLVPCRLINADIDTAAYVKMEDSL